MPELNTNDFEHLFVLLAVEARELRDLLASLVSTQAYASAAEVQKKLEHNREINQKLIAMRSEQGLKWLAKFKGD